MLNDMYIARHRRLAPMSVLFSVAHARCSPNQTRPYHPRALFSLSLDAVITKALLKYFRITTYALKEAACGKGWHLARNSGTTAQVHRTMDRKTVS